MLTAAPLSLLVGACLLLVYLPLALAPQPAGRFWATLPRNRWVGFALSAICLLWASFYLKTIPMGVVERIKPYLPVLTVVTIGLVWAFMPDLLMCRALGGLLVLLPTPLLKSSWHLDTNWRYVIIALAYIMAIDGMILILSPFRLRQVIDWVNATPSRLRNAGAVGSAVGLLLILLGLTVYR